jgi:hypothetical protein
MLGIGAYSVVAPQFGAKRAGFGVCGAATVAIDGKGIQSLPIV